MITQKEKTMKRNQIAVAVVAASMLLSSCGLSNAIKGGGIGAAAGGLLGAGIGKVAGNTGVGAAIGAVVGGAAGTLIGNKMDKQKKALEEQLARDAKIESLNDGQAIRVTFDSGILFATGKAALSSQAKASLDKLANNLGQNVETNIQIVGHTDNTGSDRVNDPLSVNRAKSVYDYLTGKGVVNTRMEYLGKGSKDPIADNATATGRQENRRVEVYILPSQAMIEAAQNGTLR